MIGQTNKQTDKQILQLYIYKNKSLERNIRFFVFKLGLSFNSFINHELSFYFNKTQFILLNLDQG